MTKLSPMKPAEVVRVLERAGFVRRRQTGSHARLVHPQNETLQVTVSVHHKDLARWTLNSILKQANLSPEDFLKLL